MATAGEVRRAAQVIVDRARSSKVVDVLQDVARRVQNGDVDARRIAIEILEWDPPLSATERGVFDRLDGHTLSLSGAVALQRQLGKAQPDVGSWANEIRGWAAAIQKAVSGAETTLKALGGSGDEVDADALGFRFAHEASIETLEELERAASALSRLVQASYRIVDLTPRPATLESVDHGSVIVKIVIDAEAVQGFAVLAGLALQYASVRLTYRALRQNADGQRLTPAATALDKVEDQELKMRMEEELKRAFPSVGGPAADDRNETRNLASTVANWFGQFLTDGGRMVYRVLDNPTARLQREINAAADTGSTQLPSLREPAQLGSGENDPQR